MKHEIKVMHNVYIRGVMVHVFILNCSVWDVWFGMKFPQYGSGSEPSSYCQKSNHVHIFMLPELEFRI